MPVRDGDDPREDQPTYTMQLSGGLEVMCWFGRYPVEDCSYCAKGLCLQKVMRSSKWNDDIIVHLNPHTDMN